VSFSDQAPIKPSRKVGCLVYAIVAILVVGFCLLLAAMGHNECSYEPELPGCEWDGVRRFLLFPGSLIIAIVGGVFLARWAMRDH